MLAALGRWLTEPEQVIIRCAAVDSECQALLREYTSRFAPNSIVLAISDATAKELEARAPFIANLERKGRLTVYECRNFACELPKVIA
jgi:hypothetical protein